MSDDDPEFDVFISYAREDQPHALKLYADLCAQRLNVWMDVERLMPGQDWQEETLKAMGSSRYVVVLLSQVAVSKRGFLNVEIRKALELSKYVPHAEIFLIPARIQPCVVPGVLSSIQWVDLFPSYADGLRSLLAAIRSETRGKLSLPIAAAVEDLGPRSGGKGLLGRSLGLVIWYTIALASLIRAPKTYIRTRNEQPGPNLSTALQFLVVSALPFSTFNALLPLDSGFAIIAIVAYLFINLLLVLATAWATQQAWRLVGWVQPRRMPARHQPWSRYAITNSYYSGVVYFLGFLNVMVAVGVIKLLDKNVLFLLRDAAAGNLKPLVDAWFGGALAGNVAVSAALWILGVGHVLLLFWTFLFWGSYREMNRATTGASLAAWAVSCVFVIPIGVVVALLQQAFFNRLTPG